jgi:hypothetical protein
VRPSKPSTAAPATPTPTIAAATTKARMIMIGMVLFLLLAKAGSPEPSAPDSNSSSTDGSWLEYRYNLSQTLYNDVHIFKEVFYGLGWFWRAVWGITELTAKEAQLDYGNNV